MGDPGGRLSQQRVRIGTLWQDKLGTYIGTEERQGGWYRVDREQEEAESEVLRKAGAGYVSFHRSP